MMREGTVCFILDQEKVLLALIDYSGNQKWSGIGGFIDEGESPEDAVVREMREETHIIVSKSDLRIRGVIEYIPNLRLNVLVANKWSGQLKVKDLTIKELKWFSKDQLPFAKMHSGNEKWLPRILSGEYVEMSIKS